MVFVNVVLVQDFQDKDCVIDVTIIDLHFEDDEAIYCFVGELLLLNHSTVCFDVTEKARVEDDFVEEKAY